MSIINSNFQREGEGGEGRDQRPPPRDRGGQGAVGAGGKRRELGNSFFLKKIYLLEGIFYGKLCPGHRPPEGRPA